jgi:hypothetical protein
LGEHIFLIRFAPFCVVRPAPPLFLHAANIHFRIRRGRPHYDYDCFAPRQPPAGLLYLRPPSVHTHIHPYTHDRESTFRAWRIIYTIRCAHGSTFGGITRRPRRRPYRVQQPRARKYIHNGSSKADHPLMRLPHYSSALSLCLSLPASSSCVSTAVRPDGWRNDCCTHVSACFGASQPASQPTKRATGLPLLVGRRRRRAKRVPSRQ